MIYRFYTQEDYPGIPLPYDAIALMEQPVNGDCLLLTNKGPRALTPHEAQPMLHYWMRELNNEGSA